MRSITMWVLWGSSPDRLGFGFDILDGAAASEAEDGSGE